MWSPVILFVASRGATHQQFDGVQNDLVPVVYDAVCVILYQILRAVTCLELLGDMDSITGFDIKKYGLLYPPYFSRKSRRSHL